MTDREGGIKAIEKALAVSKAVDGEYIYITCGEAERALELLLNMREVTHCTACKHWDQNSGLTARKCGKFNAFTKQFDYCSYGEAK
jgi:hypothetical protein